MSTKSAGASVRGRPTDEAKQEEQKRKLIEATQGLMQEKSYKSITIREIGDKAGINSAMVRYYFGSKEGMVMASFQDFMASHFSGLQSVFESERPIKPFIELVTNVLSHSSVMARLIHDEILNDESTLREAFINGFPSKIAQALPDLVKKEVLLQQPNAQLNWKYAAFNLVSMLILPFMGAPVRQIAWEISDEELSSPEWVEHVYQQFMSGCLNREK